MRAAILFTTYTWDEFAARQYAALTSNAGGCDVFVIADETAGSLGDIPVPNLIRTSQRDLAENFDLPLILPPGWESRNPLWWNLDCLIYRFFAVHPEYEYCLTLDYDARVNLDIPALLAAIAARNLDFVAKPVTAVLDDWFWREPHAPLYPISTLKADILCVTILSRRAANFLAARRRSLAAAYKSGVIAFWPFCEAFMPTELAVAGFAVADLADFGDTTHLGWTEVWRETDTLHTHAPGFIHPVMDETRFLPAFIARYRPLRDIFCRHSRLACECNAYPVALWLPLVAKLAIKRGTFALRAAFGLNPR